MGKLGVYQQLQIGFYIIIVGMFLCFLTLDLLHYEMSDLVMGMYSSIWAIILVLVDPKTLLQKVQKGDTSENNPPVDNPPA